MPKPENILGQGFHTNPERINKKGRPKLPDIKEALEKILNEEKDGVSSLEAVLKALRMKAVKGDIRAIQELLDRYYGKPKQTIESTSQNIVTIKSPINWGDAAETDA